jgi:hypothetical protein
VLALLLFGVACLVLGLLAVKILLGLVFLPFRIVGGLFKLALGIVGGLLGLVLSAVVVAFALVAVVFGLVLVPLAPFIVLGGLCWLAFRAGRHGVARAV